MSGEGRGEGSSDVGIELGLLAAIERDSSVTQRSLARGLPRLSGTQFRGHEMAGEFRRRSVRVGVNGCRESLGRITRPDSQSIRASSYRTAYCG